MKKLNPLGRLRRRPTRRMLQGELPCWEWFRRIQIRLPQCCGRNRATVSFRRRGTNVIVWTHADGVKYNQLFTIVWEYKMNNVRKTDLMSICREMQEINKQNRYLQLRLRYRTTKDSQMKKLYKHWMDILAKSIRDKKAIWL